MSSRSDVRRVFLAVVLAVGLPAVGVAHPSAQHEIEALSVSIEARPGAPQLYLRRGRAYAEDGRHDLALADYRRAEALGDPVLAAFHQGVLHHRMGKLAEARAYFDAFLARFPHHPKALEHRALLLRDAGEAEAALADFRAYFALQKRPNPGDYVSASRLLAELERKGVGPALDMLDEGMGRLGVIPQLQRPAIELSLSRGDVADAVHRLGSLEPALGESPGWKVEMAELLVRIGRAEEARAHLDAAAAKLAVLRRTAARAEVQERLLALRARLGARAVPPGGSRSAQ